MVIKLKKEEKSVSIFMEGRLDSQTAPEVQDKLLAVVDQYETIVIDAEKLTYVSSAGLRVFLMLQKRAVKTGSALSLIHMKPEIQEVFEMTGFSSIMNIL